MEKRDIKIKYRWLSGICLSLILLMYVNVNAMPDSGLSELGDLKNQTELVNDDDLDRNITGLVTDRQGDPIPGVTVVVPGAVGGTVGTTTDADGRYELTVPDNAEFLLFTFIGMRDLNVPIEGRSEINITMEADLFDLDEVVVVGYGTQRRANVIGSVTSIQSRDLTDAPVSNVSNALTGRLPGGIFMQEVGEPGEDQASILVRGNSTLNNNDLKSARDLFAKDTSTLYGGSPDFAPASVFRFLNFCQRWQKFRL
ncbi:MAG: carboxypeptidase-like regulatory domain-containing protein [Balneolaceae bacterium]|nr:carboxypeptidase-like regulatory domain-containing protein [Balneolaceae bacterium]